MIERLQKCAEQLGKTLALLNSACAPRVTAFTEDEKRDLRCALREARHAVMRAESAVWLSDMKRFVANDDAYDAKRDEELTRPEPFVRDDAERDMDRPHR